MNFIQENLIYIIGGILLIYIVGIYNSLVRGKINVKQSKSTIDVYLKQRFDLIPNLVEVVKGFSKHERETLDSLISLRNQYNDKLSVSEESQLNNNLSKLIAVVEDYPNLKASEQYFNLQKKLSKVENQLQAARRIYNTEVTDYNNNIQKFPNMVFASIFRFKSAEFFQIEVKESKNSKVNL